MRRMMMTAATVCALMAAGCNRGEHPDRTATPNEHVTTAPVPGTVADSSRAAEYEAAGGGATEATPGEVRRADTIPHDTAGRGPAPRE